MSARLQLPLAVLLAVVVRVPFWSEALRTPVDGDTAIIGLMARHPLRSTTMWGQPYGSPVEAWLASPLLSALGWTDDALRLAYFLFGLALVPVAWALGRALDPRAALPAALLAAAPPPYMLLLSSLPPPMYPAALVLAGVVLVLTLRGAGELQAGRRPWLQLVLAGALAGLALWTHLMTAAVIAPCAVWLFWRAKPARRALLAALLPLLVTSAPWWSRALMDRAARRIVRVEAREQGMGEHLAHVLPRMHQPIGGLVGTHVPLVADDAQHVVVMPWWLAAAAVLAYGGALIVAARAAGSNAAAPLLFAVAAATLLAFPLPLRSGPGTIRFVTPLWLALVALTGWVAARCRTRRRTGLVVLSLMALHLAGGARLLGAWRRADRVQPPFLLVDLDPARRLLESLGVRHVYASYGPAWRLSWNTRERLLASQPWNERFLHSWLPYLDEVRFAKNVAWVLTPGVPSDLPAPAQFEQALGTAGGGWRRAEAGGAIVYYGFAPPFGAAVETLATAGAAGDGDPGTALSPSPTQPTTFALPAPRTLDAVTLVAGLQGPRLPRSFDLETSGDGVLFEAVARRRRRGEREDLRWVNGHPQFVLDHDVIAVPLGGRRVAALRLVPIASADPWTLGELLLHPASPPEARGGWQEWLDPRLDWPQRRQALRAHPLPHRQDWYSRLLLAARAR